MGSRRKFLEGLTRSAGSLAFLSLANPSFAEEAYLKMEKYGPASSGRRGFLGMDQGIIYHESQHHQF
jgi:hypothetical protein